MSIANRLLNILDKAIQPTPDEARLSTLRGKLDGLAGAGAADRLIATAVAQHRARIEKMPTAGRAGEKRERLLTKLSEDGLDVTQQIRLLESYLADVAMGNTTRTTSTTSATTTATAGRSLTQVTNQALAMSGADVPPGRGTATSTRTPVAPPTPCLSQYQILLSANPRKAAEYHLEHRTQIFEEIAAAENARLAAARRKG
jgi:hypothetical protein